MSISPGSSSFYFPLVFMLTEKISHSMKMIVHIKAKFTLHFFYGKELCQLCLLWKGRLNRKQFLHSIVGYFPLSRFEFGSVCRVRISTNRMFLLLSILTLDFFHNIHCSENINHCLTDDSTLTRGMYAMHTTDTEFSVTNLFYLHLSD